MSEKKLEYLGEGSSSIAYKMANQIYKLCKKSDNDDYKQWIKSAANESIITSLKCFENKSYKVCKSVLSKIKIDWKELDKNVIETIPKRYKGSEEYVMVQPLIKGEELNKEFLDSLDGQEKSDIEEKLAEFLYDLHSVKKDSLKTDIPLENDARNIGDSAFNNIAENLGNYISKEDIREFISDIKKDKNLGKKQVLSHGDLIADNILYDKENKHLTIIDFGDASYRDAYTDFACLLRKEDNDFVKGVIDKYNKKAAQNGDNTRINFETAQKMAVLQGLLKFKKPKNKLSKSQLKCGNLMKLWNNYQKTKNQKKQTKNLYAAINSATIKYYS